MHGRVRALLHRRSLGVGAALALGLALALATPSAAGAQSQPDSAAAAIAPAGAPEPLWVPDPEDAAASAAEAGADPLAAAAVDVAGAAAATAEAPIAVLPGDDARVAVAHWMAQGVQASGLPGELPVMAALVESSLRNLPYGDADSVGFFQMRMSIWNRGPYEGYLTRPELQLRWFIDHALAVRDARRAAGDLAYGEDPASWGEWIASIERPAARYRGRYVLRLAEAQALLATPAPPLSPFEMGLTVGDPAVLDGTPDALARRVLSDARIELSGVAREDLEAGRIDPRLSSVLLEAAAIEPIALSVFQTGHSYLTVNGNVSNHSFGRGVDISTVGGQPVTPGNEAARTIALALARLPEEIRPTEIGTPWAIDDPAYFTDGGHQDHLHVGFDTTAAGAVTDPTAGIVQTVAATARVAAPRTRAVAPAEPRFDAGAGSRARSGHDPAEPRFQAGEDAP